jgi:uncharacterized protein DUF2835
MNQHIRFNIRISYDHFLSVYQGISKMVRTKAEDGRVIEFPAGKIQQFLTRDGITGTFEMELTENHKFVGIRKLR